MGDCLICLLYPRRATHIHTHISHTLPYPFHRTYAQATKVTLVIGRVEGSNCQVQLRKNGVVMNTLPPGTHVVRTYSLDMQAGDVLSLTEDTCMAALISIEHETRMMDVDPTDIEDIHAAHFMVMHTPNVVQRIEGVQFDNMGQAGRLGRYPFHMHSKFG